MIDTLRAVETPEGVLLTLRTAGLHPRAMAALIDMAVRWSLYLVLALVAAPAGQVGVMVLLAVLFAGEWFYPVLFEVLRDGATPGKRALGLRVVHDDGTPVTFTSSLLRNLLLAADFFPLGYATGMCCMLWNGESRRLGDLAAGTVVVHVVERPRGAAPPRVAPAAPPLALDGAEQQAILDFADRVGEFGEFGDARRVELAGFLEPLTGLRGPGADVRALGIARAIGEVR